MAPREDLVSSAVNFLQDPSVASSPVEKRIEFLKSKNLTQEEIELALSQAAGAASIPQQQNAQYYPPPSQQPYTRPPPGYAAYSPYGQWQQQQPPPELPRRDWRDWFIMATVLGGASYGVYALAQRYIKPLIAPPTPPQLEQDKAAIDEQFNKAFTLLDTLTADTTALKEAEEARTKKLDAAISDVESIVQEIKTANQKREDDARRMEAEVKGMKDSLPRAIDSVRDGSERQLKELSSELASLKLLMSNRMSGSSSSMFPPTGQSLGPRSSQIETPTVPRSTTGTPISEIAPGSKSNVTGVNGPSTTPSFAAPNSQFASSTAAPASSTSMKPAFGASSGKTPSIPAWQIAAQSKSNSSNPAGTPQPDGAEAVAVLNAS